MKWHLIESENVKVTKLTYHEMMFYVQHNVPLFVDCLIQIKRNHTKIPTNGRKKY